MYLLHNARWKTDLDLQVQLPPIHEHRHISYNPGQNILAVKTSAKADIKVLFSGLVYIWLIFLLNKYFIEDYR